MSLQDDQRITIHANHDGTYHIYHLENTIIINNAQTWENFEKHRDKIEMVIFSDEYSFKIKRKSNAWILLFRVLSHATRKIKKITMCTFEWEEADTESTFFQLLLKKPWISHFEIKSFFYLDLAGFSNFISHPACRIKKLLLHGYLSYKTKDLFFKAIRQNTSITEIETNVLDPKERLKITFPISLNIHWKIPSKSLARFLARESLFNNDVDVYSVKEKLENLQREKHRFFKFRASAQHHLFLYVRIRYFFPKDLARIILEDYWWINEDMKFIQSHCYLPNPRKNPWWNEVRNISLMYDEYFYCKTKK
jgi:hypothetical protein